MKTAAMRFGWSKSYSMKIRQVRAEKESLTELSARIFEFLTAVYGISPWPVPYLLADLGRSGATYFLAESADKIIGLLAISTVMDEIEITNIAILPDFQGQGIASRLLTELSAFEGVIFLEVRASNIAAQKLYAKFGFETYHTRKNYYENPREDALLMRKEGN